MKAVLSLLLSWLPGTMFDCWSRVWAPLSRDVPVGGPQLIRLCLCVCSGGALDQVAATAEGEASAAAGTAPADGGSSGGGGGRWQRQEVTLSGHLTAACRLPPLLSGRVRLTVG